MSRTAIFTSYFSKNKHPQLGDPHIEGVGADGRVLQNDISYIWNWYSSVKELGIDARIFCDNLSDEFIKEYSTDKIQFVKVGSSPFSNNDWRFFCYRKYLDDTKWNEFDSVFLTDSSDVTVIQNPASLVDSNEGVDFFVCNDSIGLSDFPYMDLHEKAGWRDSLWLSMMLPQLELINMGVVGGKIKAMQKFLDRFCLARLALGSYSFNADMWVGQYVFRILLGDSKIMIGEPVTSKFKQYENDRKDVFFRHK